MSDNAKPLYEEAPNSRKRESFGSTLYLIAMFELTWEEHS